MINFYKNLVILSLLSFKFIRASENEKYEIENNEKEEEEESFENFEKFDLYFFEESNSAASRTRSFDNSYTYGMPGIQIDKEASSPRNSLPFPNQKSSTNEKAFDGKRLSYYEAKRSFIPQRQNNRTLRLKCPRIIVKEENCATPGAAPFDTLGVLPQISNMVGSSSLSLVEPDALPQSDGEERCNSPGSVISNVSSNYSEFSSSEFAARAPGRDAVDLIGNSSGNDTDTGSRKRSRKY